MRVYLGTTLTALAEAVAQGGFGPAPLTAFAVTPTLREWYAEGDQEELEYAATADAARASLHRLNLDPDAPARRVVVAADVADSEVRTDTVAGRSVVVIATAVPLSEVAAVHVDDDEATDAVRAAVQAIEQADAGDDDASFVVDEAFGFELLWYARQEIPELLS